MKCYACPLRCGADRKSKAGACGVKGISVAKFSLHPFEEPPISHKNGSGTIFFAGCNLKCVFCQNFEISHSASGKEMTPRELVDVFKKLEEMGAENINLVTPDHILDFLGEALSIYKPSIPVVFNSGGYALPKKIEEIFPLVDIFLPDVKFYSPALSKRYTGRENYFEVAFENIKIMKNKEPLFQEDGKMLQGLFVRHLIMPMGTGDSMKILENLAQILPKNAPISLMRQYTPMGDSQKFPELSRTITAREYSRVVDFALSLGFENVFLQSKASAGKECIPDWNITGF